MKEHFCYCYLLKSQDINKANIVPCTLCEDRLLDEKDISALSVDWACLHQEFITPDLIQRLCLQVLSHISEEVTATHKYVSKKVS